MSHLDDYDPPIYSDADVMQAEMDYIGALAASAEKAGRCTHGSAVAYRNPPCYPEQVGLSPGQVRCMDCLTVFASDEDHYRASENAIFGED